MIRDGDWKLIWYPRIDRWQLFNVAEDPIEVNDRIADQIESTRVASLRGKLVAWLKDRNDPVVRVARVAQ